MGDVVKYRVQLQKLISKAKAEGLEIKLDDKLGWIYFKDDIGECAGVEIN